jgi:hypothetical protein
VLNAIDECNRKCDNAGTEIGLKKLVVFAIDLVSPLDPLMREVGLMG